MRLVKLLIVSVLAIGLFTACGMKIPEGVHFHETYSGCTSTGDCPFPGHAANFYWWQTREIVITPNASPKVRVHELCHAHQHQTILDYFGREPSDQGLSEWAETDEGQKWLVVEATSPPVDWKYSKDNPVERFAEACARYLTYGTVQWEWPGEPYRDAFFEGRGF